MKSKVFSFGGRAILLAFAFVLLPFVGLLRAQYPIIGDTSDLVWKGARNSEYGSLEFHPYLPLLKGVTYEGTYYILLNDSMKVIKKYNESSIFSKTGKFVIKSAGSDVQFVDIETDTIFATVHGVCNSQCIDVSSDDKYLVSGGRNRVELYNVETGELLKFWADIKLPDSKGYSGYPVDQVAFNPNGREIYLAFFWHMISLGGRYYYFPSEVWKWDLEKDILFLFCWARYPIKVSPDGSLLACVLPEIDTGLVARSVELRRTSTRGIYANAPEGFVYYINSLTFSSDGRYLAYVGKRLSPWIYGHTINIYDLNRKKLVYVIDWLEAQSCAFSPDGKYFAVANYEIYLFDFERIKQKIEAASAETQDQQPLTTPIIYPNPTHDVIQLKFSLDAPLPTTINVLDLLGNNLKTIEDKLLEQGEHIFTIDLTNFSSGVYYLQVKAGNRMFNEKIVVVRE